MFSSKICTPLDHYDMLQHQKGLARGAHFGRLVFFPSGPARRWRPWKRNAEVEQRWKEGRSTGGLGVVGNLTIIRSI